MSFGPSVISAGALLGLVSAALSGCARTSVAKSVGYDSVPRPIGISPSHPASSAKHVPEDVVARAAGDVTALRLSDDQELEPFALSSELLKSDAICAGEEHDSAEQHFAELYLLTELSERAPSLGLELGVGFEMWEKSKQGALSSFGRGKLSESDLLKESGYKESWGFPFAYYRPLLEKARAKGLPLIALNASHEVTERIAEDGLDGLDPDQSRTLPTLDLGNSSHHADFEARMKQHPGVTSENLANYYAAQVVWDETMADTAASWLELHAPIRRIMIVAGQAHCQRTAIPSRMERRGVRKVAAVWLGVQRPPASVRERYDYALVVGSPHGE